MFFTYPTYVSIQEHDFMKPNELIMTTCKVAL